MPIAQGLCALYIAKAQMTDESAVAESAPVDAPLHDEVAQEAPQSSTEVPSDEAAQVDKPTPETTTAPEADGSAAKPKNRTQARIDELTWKAREAERVLAEERQQRAALQQQMVSMWTAQQQAQVHASAPKFEDFTSIEDYQRAVYAHVQSKQAEIQQQQAQYYQAENQRQHEFARQQALEAAIQGAESIYPDFREKVSNPALPPLQTVNPAAFQAIMASEQGAHIAYYLANNASEAIRIARLQPIDAVRELGKLEAKLATTPGKTATAAPRPVTTLGTNEVGSKDPSKMSMDEYRRWRSGK